jgi:LEA14-like dessication related protein
MKNSVLKIFTIAVFGLTNGCTIGPQMPAFINLNNVAISNANTTKTILTGDAIFNNPNPINGKLTKTNIHIKVNDVDITDIEQDVSIDVPKNSNFIVPVSFSFNPQQLLEENEGFLKNVLKSFVNKELKIDYKGTVTVEVMGVSFAVPVEYSENVSLGLNYEDAE